MRTFHSDLSWNLVVASPSETLGEFKESVIFLLEDNLDGALGVVINRPLDKAVADFSDIAPDSELGTLDVYEGGPVGMHELKIAAFVLGDCEVGSFRYGISPRELENLEKSSYDVKPMAFLGCVRWGREQLREELKSGYWFLSNVDMNLIFDTPPEELWEELMLREFPTVSELDSPDGNFKSN